MCVQFSHHYKYNINDSALFLPGDDEIADRVNGGQEGGAQKSYSMAENTAAQKHDENYNSTVSIFEPELATDYKDF